MTVKGGYQNTTEVTEDCQNKHLTHTPILNIIKENVPNRPLITMSQFRTIAEKDLVILII